MSNRAFFLSEWVRISRDPRYPSHIQEQASRLARLVASDLISEGC